MKTSHDSREAYEVFRPLMKRFGANCSPVEFYWAVNEAFHAAESKQYNDFHEEMFLEEEKVWKRLFQYLPENPKQLSFLDVGTGTGLVGDFAERFCGDRIAKMTLLDPSAQMIEQAKISSGRWRFPVEFHQGDIYSLGQSFGFDVISVNSVLHHVVDLKGFLSKIQSLLNPGGILLTAQDPNDGLDPILNERKRVTTKRIKNETAWASRIRQILGPILKKILCIQRFSPLARVVNEQLLNSGIISRPMSQEIIWAVTDIQVPNQPYGLGNGITLLKMKEWMAETTFKKLFSYHFHGISFLALSESEKQMEWEWWNAEDPHGSEMAMVWEKEGDRRCILDGPK